jgi:hypothetical protein
MEPSSSISTTIYSSIVPISRRDRKALRILHASRLDIVLVTKLVVLHNLNGVAIGVK